MLKLETQNVKNGIIKILKVSSPAAACVGAARGTAAAATRL